jgi:[CysO sulfur-carrier protein]-S-L-cysteine hydrolase
VSQAEVARRPHPGPAVASLAADIVQALIDHARAEVPNEACGLIVGDRYAAEGGQALRYEPARSRTPSPYVYEIHPDDLLRLTIATDEAEEVFWAIAHSHTHTPARPSPTDIRQALYPDALYILVSLSEDEAEPSSGAPSVRAWRIVAGDVFEVELQVSA